MTAHCVARRVASRVASGVAGMLLSLAPFAAGGQGVAPGPMFKSGAFHRWVLGNDYRDLWATPILESASWAAASIAHASKA